VRRVLSWLLLSTLVGVVSCSLPTAFKGEAKVPGGAAGCHEKCAALGMDLAGMVVMGEYSDGCVCRVKDAAAATAAPLPAPPAVGAPPATPPTGAPASTSPPAVVPAASGPTAVLERGESLDVGAPAVVGVVMRAWAQAEQRRRDMREQRQQFWGH